MTFLIQQTLIYAVPLMIVALAGVFAERSGIINLALEGIMIFGAFAGVLFVNVTQKAGIFSEAKAAGDWMALQGFMLLAMLVAAILGAVFSLLLSFASVNLKADQTIGGTALNLMAPALVLFFIRIIANQNTLQMAEGDAASWFMLKKSFFGYGRSDEMGFFGDTFINKAYLATYICIILFVVLSILLYKTRFGLRLRSCGENPQAADSLGINVYVMRYAGTTISGALAGMGGFVYALTTANCASTGDVAGFGFLALAVMIFGNWKPLNIAGAALLFGLFKCIAASYASIDINGDGVFLLAELGISPHFYRMLPYIITLVVLAFTSKKSRAPKAEGIPYDKESGNGVYLYFSRCSPLEGRPYVLPQERKVPRRSIGTAGLFSENAGGLHAFGQGPQRVGLFQTPALGGTAEVSGLGKAAHHPGKLPVAGAQRLGGAGQGAMEPAVLRLGEQIGGQTVFQRKQQVVGGAEGIHYHNAGQPPGGIAQKPQVGA